MPSDKPQFAILDPYHYSIHIVTLTMCAGNERYAGSFIGDKALYSSDIAQG